MPEYPQGLASFPGVKSIISATATLAHGISPSAIRMDITPQTTAIAEGGTFTITYGKTKIEFKDCKIDSGSFTRNGSGQIISLAILDRRWKWKFGQISGSYNLRERDGKIIKSQDQNAAAQGKAFENTEKTPKELAKLCLKAMGEDTYDIDDLPNDSRPTVNWEYDNPAQALQEICDDLGCRIVLQPDNKVAIRRSYEKAGGGLAGPVPDGPFIDGAQTIDPPERPDSLILVTGRERFQVDIPLRAVGIDIDGSIKPIDELSYKPAGGWDTVPPPFFGAVDEASRELAKKSVYRMYQAAVPFYVPGFGVVERLSQILPIEDEMVDTVTVNGEKSNKKAQLFGIYYVGNTGDSGNNVPKLVPLGSDTDKSLYARDFTIDTAKGVVRFSEYTLANSADNRPIPATLMLRTAISVKDGETGAWIRRERKRDSNAKRLFGTKPRYIKREEVIPTRRTTYDPNTYAPGEIETNDQAVDKECDYYLDAAEQEYKTNDPTEVKYAGILDIPLDGSIQSVTWSIGGIATTAVSRNQDRGSPTTLPYKLRRNAEKAQSVAASDKAAKQVRGLPRGWYYPA